MPDKLADLNTNLLNPRKGYGYTNGPFVYWHPYFHFLPNQGWKIHISSYFDNKVSVFNKVKEFCFQNNISFKVLKTDKEFSFFLSKKINRASAGKFITIYPESTNEFKTIIKSLYQLLIDEHGPYVLSDKRYLNCTSLYYRFGGIARTDGLLSSPENKLFLDYREPFYHQPEFVEDPLNENKHSKNENNSKLFANYMNITALHFSNSGGIYVAKNKKKSKSHY